MELHWSTKPAFYCFCFPHWDCHEHKIVEMIPLTWTLPFLVGGACGSYTIRVKGPQYRRWRVSMNRGKWHVLPTLFPNLDLHRISSHFALFFFFGLFSRASPIRSSLRVHTRVSQNRASRSGDKYGGMEVKYCLPTIGPYNQL